MNSSSALPPGGKVQLGQWAVETFAELRLLRASLRQTLIGEVPPSGGTPDNVPDRMVVIATELAANAMAHAKPPTTVRLFRTDTTLILDVADSDPWVVPQVADEHPSRAGGLGMFLARKLSDDIGWYLSDGTKHVWAQVAMPTAHPGTGDEAARP